MENKANFKLRDFKNVNKQNFDLEPYDFEKYRLLYLDFGKNLNKEQYEFCRQNGSLYKIKKGLSIKVLNYNWEEQS